MRHTIAIVWPRRRRLERALRATGTGLPITGVGTRGAPGAWSRSSRAGAVGRSVRHMALGSPRLPRRGANVDWRRVATSTAELDAAVGLGMAAGHRTLSRLSGGNIQRVLLTRVLGRPDVRLLVAAYPSRGLDIATTRRAQELLLQRRAAGTDALLLPTAPEHPTLAEVAADPIGVNSRLRVFTNFVNLLDLCAVAVPAGVGRSNGRHRGEAPFGVTVIGRAFSDHVVADIARRLTGETGPATVATEPGTVAGGRRGGEEQHTADEGELR